MALFDFVLGWILPGTLKGRTSQERLVITMAIFESVAIFGLLAAFLTHDWRLYIGPWVLALVGFIRAFPRGESEARPGSV